MPKNLVRRALADLAAATPANILADNPGLAARDAEAYSSIVVANSVMETNKILLIRSSHNHNSARKLTGAMTWQLREHGMFTARAVKDRAVSLAVSCVATCNKRVASAGVTLGITPRLTATEKGTDAVEMTVKEVCIIKPEDVLEYKVSGHRRHDQEATKRLAIALAKVLNEGKCVAMKCIGAAAVYRAVLAAIAVINTTQEELALVPFWETIIEEDGSETSLLSLEIW